MNDCDCLHPTLNRYLQVPKAQGPASSLLVGDDVGCVGCLKEKERLENMAFHAYTCETYSVFLILASILANFP